MSFDVTMEQVKDVLLVRISGELDHHTASRLREDMDAKLQESGIVHVVLNASELSFMDSSGIGVVLGRYKQIAARGGQVYVCEIPPQVERIFEMAGLFKVLKKEEKEARALQELGAAS
ncbi:SpoIIAA-like anti-anti-sigma regulatory factor [Salsuginibacillus halophilus]|uniref:Anti-sigma F factor antagonist n=1 Tax=Salsuginibacillus halophilus TaxID=517424 RepID=A0A2P8HAR5_9BACI|nr:anti-sigma F factor antagonist [Salsuginibacillus halophilus]PSL43300.1 SpoIIAA-like anti-anti-sigma regulatory factor [Salsuginibacillus halophilus]